MLLIMPVYSGKFWKDKTRFLQYNTDNMSILQKYSGLYTDQYELTMAQGYWLTGLKDKRANFDYFFRKNPFDGGYVVFAGLGELLEYLENLSFDQEDCEYLESIGFDRSFISWLADFSFKGSVYSVREGELVFPNEPVLRVEGSLIEAQIVETLILNILNFESLIATKASRMRQVAGRDKLLIDFGLRRSHGYGGMQASRAAIIGGFNKTSNVLGAMNYGLEPSGTIAHSWIQTFKDELTAFRKFATLHPDNCVLLVDTYDTLKSGIPNAIKVAHEMEKKESKLLGVRLDSGDLAYLSKKARKMFDEAGMPYVKIVVSNQLDEYVIQSLREENAPIDVYGVGTALVIGRPDAALDGVYKQSMFDEKLTMKLSENPAKKTLPGTKSIWRYTDKQSDLFYADGILISNESATDIIYHPFMPEKHSDITDFLPEKLTHQVMEKGRILTGLQSPYRIQEYVYQRLQQLSDEFRRFLNPHDYKTGISRKLLEARNELSRRLTEAL